MKKRIAGGLVYDGTGAPPRRADLLLEDGRIAGIGSFDAGAAEETVDTSGLAVTPAFIDSHRHCDFAAVSDPGFGGLELAQGIGTVLGGNCGMSPFPSSDASRAQMYDFIEPCLGRAPAGFAPTGFAGYRAALEKTAPAVNVGSLVGTGAVKVAAKGFAKTPYTQREMERAQGFLKEALEEGAFGISSGIMYTPECYSTREEFVRLLSPAARFGRVWTCHIRGEGDSLVPSVEEVIDIARRAQLPLNISHFKSVGCGNWHDAVFRAVDRIEAARARGQDVTVDYYPYTGGSTTLLTLVPPSCAGDGTEALLRALGKPEGVEKLRRELARPQPGWDNMARMIGWERIVVSSVSLPENKRYQGRNIKEICEERGCDPAALTAELLVSERGKVGVILMSMAQEDVDTVAKLPYSAVISDSLYGAPDFPHPRLYGSFAKIIRDAVRERKLFPLETAVHKMTGMTAARFGIPARGVLREGAAADLNLFDPAAFGDRATFGEPKQPASGMEAVLLGGETVWRRGRRTGRLGARVLLCGRR